MVDDPLVESHLSWLAAQLTLAPLLVGYSGGLDSHVLLCWLARRRPVSGISLQAVHVHHGLNPRADEWAAHCQRGSVMRWGCRSSSSGWWWRWLARESWSVCGTLSAVTAAGYLLTGSSMDEVSSRRCCRALKRGLRKCAGWRRCRAPPRGAHPSAADCLRASLRWAEGA